MKKKHAFLPALLLVAFHVSAFAQDIELPFRLMNGKHVWFKTKVNNAPDSLLFIFDVGATTSLLDSASAVKMGIAPNYRQTAMGAGGEKTYNAALKQSVQLTDQVKIDNVDFVLTDLSRLARSFDKDFDGIIGYSILNNFLTEIDMDRKKLILHPKGAKLNTEGYTAIPFDFYRGIAIPQITVTIELKNGETFTGIVFFDTGAGSNLFINAPFSLKNGIKEKIGNTLYSESENLTNTSVSETGIIRSLSFNGFKFGEMPVRISSDKSGVSSFDGYLGILGNEIIDRFNVILDYDNKQLLLKPNSLFSLPFAFDVSGVKLSRDKHQIIIDYVNQDSEAYKKGLRKKQKLISVNGVQNGSMEYYMQLLKEEGKEVNIVAEEDGRQVKASFLLKRLI